MTGTLKLVSVGESWELPTWESTVDGKRANGSRRQMRERRQCKTRKEAEAWHNTRLVAAITGTIESKRDKNKREKATREKNKRESIGATIDAWLARREPALGLKARARYHGLSVQIKRLIGDEPIASFSRRDGYAFYAKLAASGGAGESRSAVAA